ncbi:MAG: FkbM family methyltransferase [Candidatus Humimicrobiaceae bacterium]
MNANEKRNKNKKFLTRLGSNWGGHYLDMELIPNKSLIISAGLSYDISFDEELIKRKQCYVIGIDPTYLTARTIFKYHCKNFSIRKNFILIRKAVLNKTGLTVSLGGPARTFISPQGEKAKTISLDDIVSEYAGASVLKLDIEGAEFLAIESLSTKLRTPQIVIEFHVWLNSVSDQFPNEGIFPLLYTPEDVINAVKKIKEMGYKLVYEERTDRERIGQEALFIRKEFASKYEDIELLD